MKNIHSGYLIHSTLHFAMLAESALLRDRLGVARESLAEGFTRTSNNADTCCCATSKKPHKNDTGIAAKLKV
ncbi:hypothetical protein [Rhizobium leguminosarum]|uniref:hypothetical protein n=1 Tax=Rhizobium leguminosarum TaxID=384 RepID=UPI0014418624|nr:hypothetical protein [Rhizobium leguminosarum]MBY5427860.1 hypothetical protein [Rhizobium leguminosarum]NKL87365.1 hypothetical protein [Rhizobium leguminosarum bv. viciae]